MKIVRTGITRIVILTKNKAIKIPNFTYSWLHFLRGIIANTQESDIYKATKACSPEDLHLLCPVLWCSWGGWILIMPRVDTERHYKEVYKSAPLGNIDCLDEVKIRYKKWFHSGLEGDDKCDNYGYLNNNLVKIDYGQ